MSAILDPRMRPCTIASLDMLDGTPVLDIKPYIPDLFPRDKVCLGWLRGKVEGMTRSFTGEH